jgi:RNase P/RNase MRP subunit p30
MRQFHARSVGYNVAACNVTVTGNEALTQLNPVNTAFLLHGHDDGASNGQPHAITLCPQLSQAHGSMQMHSPHSIPLRQLLSRLTVVMEDPAVNIGLTSTSSPLHTFDVLAVQPTSERAFLAACQTLEIDLISLQLGARLPFPMKGAPVRAALGRGVYFEVCYAPLVYTPAARKTLIGNVLNLMRITQGGQGVILSSGALEAMQLRGPYDVVNLASTLFGVDVAAAKRCVMEHPRALLMRAATRRQTHKGGMSVEMRGVLSGSGAEWKGPTAEGLLESARRTGGKRLHSDMASSGEDVSVDEGDSADECSDEGEDQVLGGFE